MAGQETGERVAALLDELARTPDPRVRATADELVRTLVEFYGEGLARTVRLLGAAPAGSDPLAVLTADELVADLLILHDLHPEDTLTRVEHALDKVRPYLGSHAGDVDVLGLDEGTGLDAGTGPADGGADGPVLRLRLRGSCEGCPSSTQTVRWTIEEAVARAAPEIARIEVEGAIGEPADGAGPLLQILPRPPEDAPGPAAPPADPGPAPGPAHWHPVGADRLPAPGRTSGTARVDGTPLLFVRLPGGLYAYRDACPACGAGLAGAALAGELLRCADCGAEYDVRHAGAGRRGHLDPLPLLEEAAGGVRVALPERAGAVS
ncbi:NifU family protein [Streptomyces sp. NPDC091281]|uniref:NifU family protein n=1 Tax=Streptomyces sp. NPDC091281 TaxID=3365985 RepID=UPI00381F7B09